ncbi:putative MFS family arabinose efflux permease [Bradyrhizobium japonicum]
MRREDADQLNGFAVNKRLVPFALIMWLGFLSIGMPLPVLSIFVQDRLGFDALVVGFVIGAQSFATLVSRQLAGRMCDARGPKPTTFVGLGAASAAGVCYLAADRLFGAPTLALSILLIGRLLLGFGESLFITSVAAWSITRVGSANAGRAMAWSGISMYGALAVGAPVGTYVAHIAGFQAVALCSVVAPLLGAVAAAVLRPLLTEKQARGSFLSVIGNIWIPGLCMALASSGVGTISAFLALYYDRLAWSGVGLALTAFGSAYILMRLLFGGLPDKIGGFTVALASLVTEAAGLLTIWLAPSPIVALIGTALTGLGYSLVFPSMGVEALKSAGSLNRGLVLGAFFACFDLGVALAGPSAGLVAQTFGLNAVFPAAAILALLACLLLLSRLSTSNRGARN